MGNLAKDESLWHKSTFNKVANSAILDVSSLFIGREDGSIDWLMKANTLCPAGEDGGSRVDGLIMGRHSFEKVLSFDPWPYGYLTVFVLSSQLVKIPDQLKSSVSSSAETPNEMVQRLTH